MLNTICWPLEDPPLAWHSSECVCLTSAYRINRCCYYTPKDFPVGSVVH